MGPWLCGGACAQQLKVWVSPPARRGSRKPEAAQVRASPEVWWSLFLFSFSQTAQACWTWSPSRTSKTTCCRPWNSSWSWTTRSPPSCSPRCSRRWQTSGRLSQSTCSYCMWSRRRRQIWAFTLCSRRSTRTCISRKVPVADKVFLLSIALLFWGKKIWHLRNLLWKKHLKTKSFRTWSILCILFIKIHLQFTFNIKNYHTIRLFVVFKEWTYASHSAITDLGKDFPHFISFLLSFLFILWHACVLVCMFMCGGAVHVYGGPGAALKLAPSQDCHLPTLRQGLSLA